MNSPLVKKYITESLLLFIGLALGVFIFSWFRVWVVGELDTAQFRQIIDLLPKNWRQFASVDFDWLVSYLGRTSLTLDEPMLVVLVCAWGLVRGSDVVSGEMSRGTMEMLMSQPLSRASLFLTHAKMTILFLGLLMAICWLGMSLGIWMCSVQESTYPELKIPIFDYRIPLRFLPPQKETISMAAEVNPMSFLPGIMNLFCLGFCFSGFAAFCSSWDRYRWRTLGIVATFFFVNAAMKVMGMGSQRLSWIENCCLFGLYSPAESIEAAQRNPWAPLFLLSYDGVGGAVSGLGALGCSLLLVVIGVTFYWVGMRIFIRRDLG